MSESFDGEVKTVDQIKPEFSARSKSVDFETSRSKKRAQKALIESKELDGWSVSKKNKLSVRFRKAKPGDRQLEDDIWCLLYRMGFTTLNVGRSFKVCAAPGDYRQIDVLAVDDESAIFVECTQSPSPRRKSMTQLIEKIVAIRKGADKSVRDHFGKRKIGWVICTRNVQWTHADLDRAEREEIFVIRDGDIEYFQKLADLLRSAARYQFLGIQFSGDSFSHEKLAVPAMRVQIGGGQVFFNFVLGPNEILKRAYVAHKAYRDIDSYQRLISRSRLKRIGAFIDGGGQFPTNVVLNIRTKRRLRFDQKDKIGDASIGTLYLPSEYSSAFVIDGQHRLFGYAHSDRSQNIDDKTNFPVLAYENLDPVAEARMFVDINHNQKSVARNLLKEIHSSLNWDSADYDLKLDSLTSRLVLELNTRPLSPLRDRIQTEGKKKTDVRCLTITQISEPLRRKGFFGEKKAGGQEVPGPLSDSNHADLGRTLEKALEAISDLFRFVEQEALENWNLGNRPGGFLGTNMGVRSLLGVFRVILDFLEKKNDMQFDAFAAEDFMKEVKSYLEPLLTYFRNADINEIRLFRDQVGMAGVDRIEKEMMRIINAAIPEFTTSGLRDYIQSQDIEGTKRAGQLINEVNLAMHEYITETLKEEYGEAEQHWWPRIPREIRKKAAERREEETGERKEVWNYLDLIHFRAIVNYNADLFLDVFNLDSDSSVAKSKRTAWVVELNGFRQTTHHPGKGFLTKDEVDRVREIHGLIMPRLQSNDS